jgi:hypothetical protein
VLAFFRKLPPRLVAIQACANLTLLVAAPAGTWSYRWPDASGLREALFEIAKITMPRMLRQFATRLFDQTSGLSRPGWQYSKNASAASCAPGSRAYRRWKSRAHGGRPTVPLELPRLIRAMSLANPLWGAPRMHGELLKLGIDVGQTSVTKYMARRRRPSTLSPDACAPWVFAIDQLRRGRHGKMPMPNG